MAKVYWLYLDDDENIFKNGYVGVTSNLNARLLKHRNRFKNNFKYKIVFTGTIEQCLGFEEYLRPSPGIGWNEAKGGHLGYRNGHSKNSIQKIKAKRALQKSPRLGMKTSEETKLKLSAVNVGKKHKPFIRKPHTEKARRKISEVQKGKKLSEETKAKCVKALIGRPVSENTKEKIRNSVKASWELRHKKMELNLTEEPIMIN